MNNKRAAGLLLLMMTFGLLCFAKNSPSTDMGDWYYKQFNFKKAALYYARALKHDKENENLLQHLADCYRLSNNWEASEPYYAALANVSSPKPLNKLYYAEALRVAKKYSDAKVYYEAYLKSFPEDSSVKERIKGLDEIQNLLKDKGLYEIKNLNAINSSYSEFGVTMHGDNEIYFCSDRKPDVFVRRVDSWTNGTFLELYKAKADTLGNVTGSDLLESSSVNKKFHEGAPCYNEKLNELYFDRSNYNGRKVFPSADKTVKLEIFTVGWSADQNKWNGEIKAAVPFNNKEYSVCHPSLNKNGDTLYFTSDMPGGYGRADIYMSTRSQNGDWGTPRNLGTGINTSGDDMFPFIANDGTLYFSSNGHVGLGGLDIFSSKFENGGWTTLKNLGAPVNTNYDDFDFVIKSDNKHGYLCSNRTGGAGDDDIYSFVKKALIVTGVTYNAYTGDPIEGATVVANPETEPAKMLSGNEGKFTCSAEPGKDYTFNATKEGFHPARIHSFISETPEVIHIPMFPLGDITLEVTVIDKKTKQPIDSSSVKVTNLFLTKNETCYTGKDGKCTFVLDTSTNYRIDAAKETGDLNEKYLNVSTETSTGKIYPPALIKKVIELEKVKIGVPIKLENIYYDLDKWFIRPDAAVELDRLVKILEDNPTIEIELSSHTDCRASAKYNLNLSQKRAKSAVDYIESKGINMKRMAPAGYGESKLVNKCRCEGKVVVPCTEIQHQENRRTEFKVTKF